MTASQNLLRLLLLRGSVAQALHYYLLWDMNSDYFIRAVWESSQAMWALVWLILPWKLSLCQITCHQQLELCLASSKVYVLASLHLGSSEPSVLSPSRMQHQWPWPSLCSSQENDTEDCTGFVCIAWSFLCVRTFLPVLRKKFISHTWRG